MTEDDDWPAPGSSSFETRGEQRARLGTRRLVTHARTLDELRQEFVSSLAYKADMLRLEAKLETRSRQSLGLGRAISEIETLIQYWQAVELAGGRSRRRDGDDK